MDNWTDTSNSTSNTMTTTSVTVAVVLSLIVLLTIAGNVLILWAVFATSNLRGPTHMIIVNLAAADLLLGTLVLPFSVTLEVSGQWYFGSIFCDIWAAVDVLCCTASIMSLCVISLDRYIGVSRPLTYHCIMTQKRSLLLCVAVWISSLAISIGPLLGWKERAVLTGDSPSAVTCTVTTQPAYVLFSAMGSFYLPMLVILVVYWRIYRAAVRQTKFLESGIKTAKSSVSEITLRVHVGGGRTKSHCSEACEAIHTKQSRSSEGEAVSADTAVATSKCGTTKEGFVNSDSGSPTSGVRDNQLCNSAACSQQQTTQASGLSAKLFKFRRQKKAAKTLGIVVGAFLLCWLPFFIILPVESLCPSCWIPRPLFSFCFWLGYCNSCLNPFIYASTSREFQRAFHKILCRTRKPLK